jgi:hypothetical protein
VRLSRAVGEMRLRRVDVVAWERGREYVSVREGMLV